jgi:hypothetical protein
MIYDVRNTASNVSAATAPGGNYRPRGDPAAVHVCLDGPKVLNALLGAFAAATASLVTIARSANDI